MRKKIEENLPESILAEGELVIKEARKNNDVMMHGIMIFCIVFLLKSLTFARLCSPRSPFQDFMQPADYENTRF